MRKTVLIASVLAGEFTPVALSGLWGWWDFSSASGLFTTNAASTAVAANNDRIGYATDKSGNGRHLTTATATRRFTWKTGIKNGLAMAACSDDGDADGLDTAASLDSNNMSWAVVIKAPATITGGVTYGIMNAHNSSIPDGSRMFISSTTQVIVGNTVPTDNNLVIGAAISTNSFHVLGFTVKTTGTTRTLFEDNVTATTDSTAVTSGARVFRAGTLNMNNFNSPWTGHLGEIVIYSPAISDANMALVFRYLNAKWQVY